MDNKEYVLQRDRISKYKELKEELDKLSTLALMLNNDYTVKIGCNVPNIAEVVISDDKYIKKFKDILREYEEELETKLEQL